jgi:hypothetical protein
VVPLSADGQNGFGSLRGLKLGERLFVLCAYDRDACPARFCGSNVASAVPSMLVRPCTLLFTRIFFLLDIGRPFCDTVGHG